MLALLVGERLREAERVEEQGRDEEQASTAEESERILHWLELPGVRLVEIDGEWTCPVRGAARSA